MAKNLGILTRLNNMLENRECTQEEIAAYCKKTQPTISRYLSGRVPPPYDVLESLVQFAEDKRRKAARLKARMEKLA